MNIKISQASASRTKVDCLVIGIFESPDWDLLDQSTLTAQDRPKIRQQLKAKGAKGRDTEIFALTQAGIKGSDSVLIVGLGPRSKYTNERLRMTMSKVCLRAKEERWSDIRIDCPTFLLDGSFVDGVESIAEGLLLSDYRFDKYKSSKAKNGKGDTIRTVEIVVAGSNALKKANGALKRTGVICEGVNIARTLGNEPANVLYPESYAQEIRALFAKQKVRLRVFRDKELKANRMGGIEAVGRGSVHKPRLVIMEYRGAKSKNKRPIVFVGKGITFDTGGISIKPSKAMEEMKFDMCGSAAVVAVLWVAARLRLPLSIIGIVALAENMPGGNAQRPGDIITCHNGKTVEVFNTDAEGRLVLADALAYAKRFNPLCLVDAATLTGLSAHFFDYLVSSVMGNDPGIILKLKEAGEKSGERVWEVPLYEEYDEMIKGEVADIRNISRKTAGTITAGMFLKHFADHAPWAHVDIAGTAWTNAAHGYSPAGATGVGVRLFVEFLHSYL